MAPRRGALALALVLAAALALWRADRARQHTANRVRVPVIAVAPLVNVSEDPSLEPLAAGSAVVLISSLGAIPGLQVLSRDATLDSVGPSGTSAGACRTWRPPTRWTPRCSVPATVCALP